MSTTNTQAPTSNELTVQSKMQLLQNFFQKEGVQAQLNNALKDNQDSFIASVIDLYSGDSYLQNCHPELVAMVALKAAVLKLPVIKALGFAYIVPYKTNNQFIPQLQIGYKGLIQLAIRTNQYRVINADVVYEGEYKSANKLTGEFDLNGSKTSDNIIGYFAHFEMTNGFSKTLYMTKKQVTEHAQKYSKSFTQAQSPWKTEFDAMAKKTTLRGLLGHWGYLSVEMLDAFTEDDRDVAEKVMDEIQQKGNMKTTGFQEADQVNENAPNLNGQPATAPF